MWKGVLLNVVSFERLGNVALRFFVKCRGEPTIRQDATVAHHPHKKVKLVLMLKRCGIPLEEETQRLCNPQESLLDRHTLKTLVRPQSCQLTCAHGVQRTRGVERSTGCRVGVL